MQFKGSLRQLQEYARLRGQIRAEFFRWIGYVMNVNVNADPFRTRHEPHYHTAVANIDPTYRILNTSVLKLGGSSHPVVGRLAHHDDLSPAT